jgi:hypothetical protein
MKSKLLNASLSVIFLLLMTGCRTSELEDSARTLNMDLDINKSPYRYAVDEDEKRLLLVLRRMPAGETAADATLRADIERSMAQKLNSQPNIVEIRIFESRPNFRREVWVAEKDGKRLAFDVVLAAAQQGAQVTVKGPVEIEGFLK